VDCIRGSGINFSHSLATAILRDNLNGQQSIILHFFSPPLHVKYTCRWNDNAVVTLAWNHQTRIPMGTAKWYTRHNKKRIDIPEPSIIRSYNKGMSGVDVLDRLLSSYRPQLRSKWWWWNLFANALNMAVVSAWQLHQELHGKTSKGHLEFRREVTMSLLRTMPRVGSRPGPRVQIPI
jgi:hypothetical protein